MVIDGSDEGGAESRETPGAGFLRIAALAAAAVGASGSVALMLREGHRNPSRLLILMFAVWVLLPFVVLVAGDLFAKRWPAPARTALRAATIVVALASLAVYGAVVLGPARPKVARFFLLVPPASILFAAAAVGIAAVFERRRAGNR